MIFQPIFDVLPTHFVHPLSCRKQLKTATPIDISTFVAVFTNTFCPITQGENHIQKAAKALILTAFFSRKRDSILKQAETGQISPAPDNAMELAEILKDMDIFDGN